MYYIPGIVKAALPPAATPKNIPSGLQSTDISPFNSDIFEECSYAPSQVTGRPEPGPSQTSATAVCSSELIYTPTPQECVWVMASHREGGRHCSFFANKPLFWRMFSGVIFIVNQVLWRKWERKKIKVPNLKHPACLPCCLCIHLVKYLPIQGKEPRHEKYRWVDTFGKYIWGNKSKAAWRVRMAAWQYIQFTGCVW